MQLKLRGAIVLAVIVGVLIPMIASSLVTLDRRQQEQIARLVADHRRLTDILRHGMRDPLWNLNPDAARPLFNAMLSDERVVAITVRDSKFGVFLQEEHPERRHGRRLLLQREVDYNDNVIGSVELEMDSGQLDASIAHDRAAFALTALAQLLLSVVLIVALLQVRLLAPLRQLMQASRHLARRELREPFVWRGRDELGDLGRSLESTRLALQALFEEIEDKNRRLERDIRRRMRVEQELQRHREHLEDLVRERTAELSVAKERAEVASRAKSTFLASMSHELRTPLNAVLGYARILRRDDNLTGRQRASLDTIRESGEHLLTLIDDLLDLSRIEAGKFELAESVVALPAYLQVIVDIIRVRAEQKGLAFDYRPQPGLPQAVMVDARRLRQVLLNLLGNAVKFTDAGGVTLYVRHVPQDAHHVCLQFEVQDSGIGLAPEQFERIFQPFEQAGDPHRHSDGSGLGLSISRELVRMMDSEIHVVSGPGQGSRFSFELSVGLADGGNPQPHEVPPAVSSAELVAPPADEMQALRQLATAGNMRGIREYAARLAQLDPRYRPFAERLQELACSYQSRAIAALVEQYFPS